MFFDWLFKSGVKPYSEVKKECEESEKRINEMRNTKAQEY